MAEVERLWVVPHPDNARYVWWQWFSERELADRVDATVMSDQCFSWSRVVILTVIHRAEAFFTDGQLPFSFGALFGVFQWAVFGLQS